MLVLEALSHDIQVTSGSLTTSGRTSVSSGSIHDDPVVRAARAGRTVEEILAEDQASPTRPKFDTTNVNSEYGFRYQNMKLDKASPRTPGEYYAYSDVDDLKLVPHDIGRILENSSKLEHQVKK